MVKNKNEISILGKKIPTQIEDIDIFKLRFWAENPRVNSSIKRSYRIEEVTDQNIEDLLREEEHVKELYQDIKRNGGLIDEIIVKGNIVLEGNSRLCAYRMLYKKAEEINDENEILKWSYIKAKIIPDSTTDEEIFVILGTWHIKGKKQWDTFEKAAYLKKMQDKYRHTSEQIGEIIGEPESFVTNSIQAHDLMVDNDVYDLEKYSYFIEMVKNRGIEQELIKDKTLQKKIITAIKTNQFKRAEEIRALPKVLKDKVAKRAFFDDQTSFADALDVAVDRHPEFDDTFYNLIKKSTTRISTIEASKIDKIKSEIKLDANKKDILRRFIKEVKKFSKQIGFSE